MRKKAKPSADWHKITDVSGRGFPAGGNPFSRAKSASKRGAPNLDNNNRFFSDNRKIYDSYVKNGGVTLEKADNADKKA